MKTDAINYNNKIAYQGTQHSDDDKRHIARAGVATTTGTAAAATTAPRASTWNIFKQFGFDTKKLESVSSLNKEVKGVQEMAAGTVNEAKGLWAGLSKNTTRFANAIIDWGKNIKANKFIKPILESSVYKKTAWGLGGAVALFVFISGVGNMISKVINGASEKKDRFIQIATDAGFDDVA